MKFPPEVKRLRREAEHSSLKCSITPLSTRLPGTHTNNSPFNLYHTASEVILLHKPGQTRGAPGYWASQTFNTIDTWRRKGCQPYAPAAFTTGRHPRYSLLLEPESNPGLRCGDSIVNRKPTFTTESLRLDNKHCTKMHTARTTFGTGVPMLQGKNSRLLGQLQSKEARDGTGRRIYVDTPQTAKRVFPKPKQAIKVTKHVK